jgi:hypothetical protein
MMLQRREGFRLGAGATAGVSGELVILAFYYDHGSVGGNVPFFPLAPEGGRAIARGAVAFSGLSLGPLRPFTSS